MASDDSSRSLDRRDQIIVRDGVNKLCAVLGLIARGRIYEGRALNGRAVQKTVQWVLDDLGIEWRQKQSDK